jgi:hypothetical protein
MCTECPWQIVPDDIHTYLHEWQQKGKHLVVFIDANENISTMYSRVPTLHVRKVVAH